MIPGQSLFYLDRCLYKTLTSISPRNCICSKGLALPEHADSLSISFFYSIACLCCSRALNLFTGMDGYDRRIYYR